MDFVKVEQYRDEVIGLRPIYNDTGKATEIMLKAGDLVIDKRHVNSVLKALARSYAVDLKAQQDNLRQLVNRRTLMPFYLNKERVFIRLKMCPTGFGNDPQYGCIDVSYILKIEKVAEKCYELVLNNGISFRVYSHKKTILQNQHVGNNLYKVLHKPEKGNVEEDSIVNSSRIIVKTLLKMSKQLDKIEKILSSSN